MTPNLDAMAGAAVGRLAGHLRHSAHVDADCREDPHDADAADQPLLERDVVCERARPHHRRPSLIARGIFEIEFDFIGHKLVIQTSEGDIRMLDLAPRTVADFYAEVMSTLAALNIDVKITRASG